MKISDILQQQKMPGGNRASGPAGAGTNFAAILQSHLRGPEAALSPVASAPTPTIGAAIPAQLRLDSLSLSQTAISTLDSFSAALGNTTLKADELEPYISALENDVAAMLDLKQELPEQDPLAKVLEEIATVSFLETAKYRRGDYH